MPQVIQLESKENFENDVDGHGNNDGAGVVEDVDDDDNGDGGREDDNDGEW